MTIYTDKFNNMAARLDWFQALERMRVDFVAAHIVEGPDRFKPLSRFKDHFSSFFKTLEWIPVIHGLQQRKTHDIVDLHSDDLDQLWVTCSCGLRGVLPDEIAQIYPIGLNRFLFNFKKRDYRRDVPLEDWFYFQPGHRDVFHESDGRSFISLHANRDVAPRRQIVCLACNRAMEFYNGGGTWLYRVESHVGQVDKHLAACDAIAANPDPLYSPEDVIRVFAEEMWKSTSLMKPTDADALEEEDGEIRD